MDKKETLNKFRNLENENIFIIIRVDHGQCQMRISEDPKTPEKLESKELLYSEHAKKWKKEEIGNLLNLLKIHSLILPGNETIQYGQLTDIFPILGREPDIHGFYNDHRRILMFLAKKTRRYDFLRVLTAQAYIVLAFPYRAKVEFLQCNLNEKGDAIPVFTDSEECDMFIRSAVYKELVAKDEKIKKYVPLIMKYKDIRTGNYRKTPLYFNPSSIDVKGKNLSVYLSDDVLKKIEN